MTRNSTKALGLSVAFGFGVLMCGGIEAKAQGPSPNVHHFAGGLNNPRGLKFGRMGISMWPRAEREGRLRRWASANKLTSGRPYSGGFTARISKIDGSGNRQRLLANLPSSQTARILVSSSAA